MAGSLQRPRRSVSPLALAHALLLPLDSTEVKLESCPGTKSSEANHHQCTKGTSGSSSGGQASYFGVSDWASAK